MNVLLVDNKSAHLKHLHQLIREKLGDDVAFRQHDPRDMSDEDVQWADLIVFSGGVGRSIVKNPQTFQRMVDLSIQYRKPTIGICLGAEAIAHYFGSTLLEMPVRRVGNVRSYFTPAFARELGWGTDNAMVYEFHKWLISTMQAPLEVLATSKDGVELFRHRELPIVGMQFHPEVRRLDNPGHLLFEHVLRSFGLRVVS